MKCKPGCQCKRHFQAHHFANVVHKPCPDGCTCHKHVYGPDHPRWKGDEVGYAGAHLRVVRARGRADSHMCGCGAPADQWSYTGPSGQYSTNVDEYVPRCHSCHRKFDAVKRV